MGEQNGTYFAVEADYIASMGVFVTASEGNRRQYCESFFDGCKLAAPFAPNLNLMETPN